MAEIELRRRGKESLWALVDDEDLDLVSQYRWYALVSRQTTYATRAFRVSGKQTSQTMHTFLTGWPLTDHIDRDGLNNRRSNLRQATPAENVGNLRSRRGASEYKGVCRVSGSTKWRAYIALERKQRHLGRFDTEEEAALAYNAAALEQWGEYALLNIINNKGDQ